MQREQVLKFLADGQQIFQRINRLPMPSVAAISGDCLGGGMELALACTYRVAAGETNFSIGLPEVKLGILPGWGGTTRLPRLIGLTHALPLLIAGKTLPPRKALKAGIVDEVVRPEALLAACKRILLAHASPRHVSLTDRVAASAPFVRHRVLATAQSQTLAKTMGHYPAAMKIIDSCSHLAWIMISTAWAQGGARRIGRPDGDGGSPQSHAAILPPPRGQARRHRSTQSGAGGNQTCRGCRRRGHGSGDRSWHDPSRHQGAAH